MVIHKLDFVKCYLSVIVVFHVLVMFLIEITSMGRVLQRKYVTCTGYTSHNSCSQQHVTSLVLEVLSCL